MTTKSTQSTPPIQRGPLRARSAACALVLALCATHAMAAEDPFANSQTALPPGYVGPSFVLSHHYPKSVPTPPMPWRAALNGKPLSIATAPAYTDALKASVAADLKILINDYPHWNAEKLGWYNQPWLSSIREPIHGMFNATQTNASLFNDPALKVKVVNNFAAVYYDATAATTVGKFWGATALTPTLKTAAAQFPEGSVIIKLAFTEVRAEDWPVMVGSPSWSIYAKWTDQMTYPIVIADVANSVFNVQLMQIDVIVKDTLAAPQTGWVYTTLVYDNRIAGDTWTRMLPLGAMWGNDPTVKSSAEPGIHAALKETWINAAAPAYALATLGWGGRLSGPNDQAVQAAGDYIDPATKKLGTVPVANSACMSCHAPAQWQNKSFLMPGRNLKGLISSDGYFLPSPASSDDEESHYLMAPPASADWMRWFQNRPGTKPMNAGMVSLDYDMMFSFKALKYWALATSKPLDNLNLFVRPSDLLRSKQQVNKVNDTSYNGLPFKSVKP